MEQICILKAEDKMANCEKYYTTGKNTGRPRKRWQDSQSNRLQEKKKNSMILYYKGKIPPLTS